MASGSTAIVTGWNEGLLTSTTATPVFRWSDPMKEIGTSKTICTSPPASDAICEAA